MPFPPWPDGNERTYTNQNDEDQKGKGYYDASTFYLSRFSQLTCTYLNAYYSLNDNLLGIQYWFYYPYHNDPGRVTDTHRHDWWYTWISYDTLNNKPHGVVYDFHHNLRAYLWENPRVHKEGFHVKIWIDAGGHRSLFAPGGDISLQDTALIWKNSLYEYLETNEYFHAELYNAFNIIHIQTSGDGHGDINNNDEIFGAMIKEITYPVGPNGQPNFLFPVIASWRKHQYTDTSLGVPIETNNGNFKGGITLNVQDFSHWVWIYKVEAPKKLPYSNIFYTGDNFVQPSNGVYDKWPTLFDSEDNSYSSHLPWLSDTIQKSGKYVSSTAIVWNWLTHDNFDPNENTPEPFAETRYLDGSP